MFSDEGRTRKRTLGMRDRQILYRNANGRCENPACGKKMDFDEMQVGHRTAHAKGGAATLRNCVCLCYRCNKLQGTDSWARFLKKQKVEDPEKLKERSARQALQPLTVAQLKSLAAKHHIKVLGRPKEDWYGLDSHRSAPTKSQYVGKLAGVITKEEVASLSAQASHQAKVEGVSHKDTRRRPRATAKPKGPEDPNWWFS